MLVRVGLPYGYGAMVRAAAQLGAPVLVSAGSCWRAPGGKNAAGFGPVPLAFRCGLDAALDSAGFTAMMLGGYRWSVSEYVAFAARCSPMWWAQMDMCCEPEIAADRAEISNRIGATSRLLAECRAMARDIGCKDPTAVLQGRAPDDYLRSADMGGVDPELLCGVGSVCRRPMSGPEGLVAVANRLERAGFRRLHMFGVKSASLAYLPSCVESVDSMAWDMAARLDRSGRGIEHRIAHMSAWYAEQHKHKKRT